MTDSIYNKLKHKLLGSDERTPPFGKVRFGDLRRLNPIDREYGYARGLPIDRYYIEKFLEKHSKDVRGRVLEIGDDSYTHKFGGDSVENAEVLHFQEGNPVATIVGDLSNAPQIASNSYDCLVLTQTLQFIYEIRAAVETMHRILKPGGLALVTVPGISQLSIDQWAKTWCWSFTTISIQKLFEEFFQTENIQVESHGNVLAATAFLQGIAYEELKREELEFNDPLYQLLITVKAVKRS